MNPDILRKIRGLLAKAESTTIDAEAETFRDAAVRLMRKYQIGEAELVASGRKASGSVVERQIAFGQMVGRDYKVALLHSIAQLHQCATVNYRPRNATARHYSSPGHVLLVGAEGDGQMVEMLWTSLCLQLDVEASRFIKQHSGRGVHGRSLRLSFVVGWVDRVMTRLEHLYGEVEESGEVGVELVLRSKKDASEQYVQEKFAPKTVSRRAPALNAFATKSGRTSGDRADIGQTRVDKGALPQLPGGSS